MSLSYPALWNVHIQCLPYVRLATHDLKVIASPNSHSSNDDVSTTFTHQNTAISKVRDIYFIALSHEWHYNLQC